MGISIDKKGEPSKFAMTMGYGAFFRLRSKIAQLIDEDLGRAYSGLLNNTEEAIAESERIINNKDLCKTKSDERLFDFLFAPDCGGKTTYGTCKKILKLVENENDTDLYGYAGWGENCSTMGDFKNLLRECIRDKKALYWC